MMLKVISILCSIFVAFGTDMKTVGNGDTSIQNPSRNYIVAQNCQEKDGTACLNDSPIRITKVTTSGSNEKQITKKKYKINLFLCCFKSKKYQNKSQKNDGINKKIKVKSENNFEQTGTRNAQNISIKGITPSLQMIRKSSAPTQRISAPIILSRRLSSESEKSEMLSVHRKSFSENVKTAILLSRKHSAESVKSAVLLSPRSSALKDWETIIYNN